MSDHGYKFYMQECDKDGVLVEGTLKDLEVDFESLKYLKIEGIEKIGAAKNIYEEKYSDSDKIRVYIPEVVQNESTTITLSLLFVGDNRFKVRDDFNEYIRHGLKKYWDTARGKWFIFYVKDELPIGESMWYGSTPYLKCDYKLCNLYGKTFELE